MGQLTWRCISFIGVGPLVFILAKMNSETCEEVPEEHLLSNIIHLAGGKWIIQHHNGPIHKSRFMKTWFKSKNIEVLD